MATTKGSAQQVAGRGTSQRQSSCASRSTRNRAWFRGTAALMLAIALSAAASRAGTVTVKVADLDGTNGFAIPALDTSGATGFAVSGVGDLNGDGVEDFALAGPNEEARGRSLSGRAYVVFGGLAFAPTFDLAALDGSNGFAIDGAAAHQRLGWDLSDAGDVNGDGIGDLIVGAPYAHPSGRLRAGIAFVVYGRSSGFPASLDLSTLTIDDGFEIRGIDSEDRAGHSVAGVGDVNTDGLDDVLVGAPDAASDRGEAYIVFGQINRAAAVELSSLDGTNGVRLERASHFSFGYRVAGAGDVNADGIPDLLLGCIDGTFGRAHVVFGRATFPASIEVSTLDGTDGFQITNPESGSLFGTTVFGVGDVNDDGIDDVAIGARRGGSAGEAYVVFGRDTDFPASLDSTELDGANGFRISGENSGDELGTSISGGGDVNGDGIDDLIVGAQRADSSDETDVGAAYLIFGRSGSIPGGVVRTPLDEAIGFKIVGAEQSDQVGIEVSIPGNVRRAGPEAEILVGSYAGGGACYIVSRESVCHTGSVNAGAGDVANVLFVNDSTGGATSTVVLDESSAAWASMVLPPQGGKGAFVVHAYTGYPSSDPVRTMPANIGSACFAIFLARGANPIAVWNSAGKEHRFGASRDFDGQAIPDVQHAPAHLFHIDDGGATFPVGTAITFQGLIVDPGSASGRKVSVTNAVTLRVR